MKINNTFFVLDTETGGLDPQKASLMQIAGVILKNGEVVYEYQSLVKSKDGKYMCNDFARRLHGITDEEINENDKLPQEIIGDFKQIQDTFFDGEPMTIIAHNPAFDIAFLKQMFVDAGIDIQSTISNSPYEYSNLFSRNVIDTATMALILRLQNKIDFDRCSLDNIIKFYEIPNNAQQRHSALYDAEQTAIAFLCMLEDLSSQEKRLQKEDKVYDEDFDDEKKLLR